MKIQRRPAAGARHGSGHKLGAAAKAKHTLRPKKPKKKLTHTSQRFMALDATTQKYYSQSLALPTPDYPLRPEGGSVVMEAKQRKLVSSALYHEQLNPNRPSLPGEDPNVTLYRKKYKKKLATNNNDNINDTLKVAKRTRLPYRLHDGPPFANGDLHMGHFLNKTLKDIANRYKLSRGYRVEFYPGWDCHGLPIELKAVEATLKAANGGKDPKDAKKNKKKQGGDATTGNNEQNPDQKVDGNNNDNTTTQDGTNSTTNTEQSTIVEIPPEFKSPVTGATLWGAHTPAEFHPHKKQIQIRDIAMKFAQSAILRQKQSMLDWSLLGDFNNPYITMDPTFEAAETLVLGSLIEKKSLYRQLMPVYWSPSSKTALAESELEYKDITSTAVYVCMPLVQAVKPEISETETTETTKSENGETTTPPFVSSTAHLKPGDPLFKEQCAPLIKHKGEVQINPEGLSLLIWTTTPWTLPANRAICVAPDGVYAHVQTSTTTTVVLNKNVYDLVETKNVVMIQSQVETLAENWKATSGLTIDVYKKNIQLDPETGEIDPTSLPPGLKAVKRGVYNTEEYGTAALVTKGKNKGDILDLVLKRDVATTIVQSDIGGNDLAGCSYISPLSLRLRDYLMKDADNCVEVDIENAGVTKVRKVEESDQTTTTTNTEEEEGQEQELLNKKLLSNLSLPIHRVIPAPHVLTDQGSGCVHTAPAHGEEDYQVGVEHKIPVACPVDEKGEYLPEVGKSLQGIPALEGGSKKVCNFLHENGALLHREEYDHRYPHDWRTLKPVMLRATSQWFCKLDDAKQIAKSSLENVFVTTDNARNRLTSFIDSRDKWCISRQRYWGLPIPIFYNKDNMDDVLHTKETTFFLSSLYSILGTQAWWSLPTWRLLPPNLRGDINPIYKEANVDLEQIVQNYLKTHNIEYNNIESTSVQMSKNKYDYTNNETINEMNNDENNNNDNMNENKKKKIVTHIDGEPVIGLPEDYYQCNWKIGEDTVDVWLDSGSSWFSALYNKLSQSHLDGGYEKEQEQQDNDENNNSNNDNNHNNLFHTLKKKRQQFLKENNIADNDDVILGDDGSTNIDGKNIFDPYKAVFGDMQKLDKKNHRDLIGNNELQLDTNIDNLSWQADVYIEGSDQHRGWFQSSLLLSSLLTGHSPFKALHSHGFVVDEHGKKMSKSLGNGVEPNSIILDQGHGVDVLRCWAASVDCSRDATMGKIAMQNTIDFVRKWRGVMRFALGCISYKSKLQSYDEFAQLQQDGGDKNKDNKDKNNNNKNTTESSTTDTNNNTPEPWDFNPEVDLIDYNDLHILDKYILHHLQLTLNECEIGYQHYQLHKVFNAVKHFMQQPLSSVYFDLSKDRLYANSNTNKDKKAALTTLYYIFSSLLKVMTPILPHLTQELFSYLPPDIQQCMVKGLGVTKQQNKKIIQKQYNDDDIELSSSEDESLNINTECVANSGWVEVKEEWKNDNAIQQFATVMSIRASVNQCIEVCRQKTAPAAVGKQQKEPKEQSSNQGGEGGKKKGNKKGGDNNNKEQQQQQETTDDTKAVQQVIGDTSIIPKIGSSNEADVHITINLPIRYKDNITSLENNTNAIDNILNILTQSNKDNLHELFMVSGTTIDIQYYQDDDIKATTAADSSKVQTYHIKTQENTHDPTQQRVVVETTTPLSTDLPEVLLTVGVAKSSGHKCPRCWRYSTPKETVEAVNANFASPQNIQKLLGSDAIVNSVIYQSFIPSAVTTVAELTVIEDPLCKRCDDFFVEQVGVSPMMSKTTAI